MTTPSELGDATNPAVIKADPDQFTRQDLQPHDVVLDTILNTLIGLEDSDNNIAISLAVKGLIVSGDVIPRGRWNVLFTEFIRPVGPDIADVLLDGLNAEVKRRLDVNSRRRREELPQLPVSFIHLKDARVRSGSVNYAIGLWRGRVDSIDGWNLGKPSD